jgi:hypothetical protein
MSEPAPIDRIERFERKIVFRTARGYFLTLAVLAVLGILGGAVLGAKGMVKVPIEPPVAPTLPEPPPAPPSVTRERLEQWLAARDARKAAEAAESARSTALFQEAAGEGTPRSGTPEASARDRERAEIRKLFDQLVALFPEPQYVWTDVVETYCARPTAFGCLQSGTRVAKAGISDALAALLKPLERSRSLEILRLWHAILPLFHVDARVTWAGHIVEAVADFDADADRVVSEYEARVANIRGAYETQVAEHRRAEMERDARREQERTWGLYGVAGGLVLLILVSIFLVHFAIERHLRLMRELAALLERGGVRS